MVPSNSCSLKNISYSGLLPNHSFTSTFIHELRTHLHWTVVVSAHVILSSRNWRKAWNLMPSVYITNSFKRASSEAGDSIMGVRAKSTKQLVPLPAHACIWILIQLKLPFWENGSLGYEKGCVLNVFLPLTNPDYKNRCWKLGNWILSLSPLDSFAHPEYSIFLCTIFEILETPVISSILCSVSNGV